MFNSTYKRVLGLVGIAMGSCIVMLLSSSFKAKAYGIQFLSVASSTTVRVSGRDILMNGTPFIIKGVGYQPSPVAKYPWQDDVYEFRNYERDLPFLRALGCNTIRTWGKVTNPAFLDACYNGGTSPIYVIMGFWVDHTKDLGDPTVRQAIIDDFKEYVTTFMYHDAVLMWLPGGEINYWYRGNVADWYSLLNELAQTAHAIERDNYHPVTTDNGSINEIGNPSLGADDSSMSALDVWGATIYRGSSFGTLFDEYVAKSSKPFWIAEYGADAWDHRNGWEYQTIQASFNGGLWNEIAKNSNVCSGGAVFEYSDEWWKNDNPFRHSPGPGQRSDQPDGWSDEEYYGIVSVENNGDNPDFIIPRQAYFTLQEKWRNAVPVLTAKVVGSAVFGRVYNISGINNYKVIIYAKTDKYYIQPWAGQNPHANIDFHGYWNMPYTHEGEIYAYLVREEFNGTDTMNSPLTIDGIGVFAEAYGGYSSGEFPTISGNVRLQRTGNHRAQITFKLCNPGTKTIIANASNDENPLLEGTQVTTRSDGSYALNDVPPGIYDITAQAKAWLGQKKANVVVHADSTTALDFNLRGGDANSDNKVNILDLFIVKSNYGKVGDGP